MIVSLIVVLLSAAGRISLPFSAPTMVILIALLFLIFPNFMEFSYQRWRRQIDEAIPSMLTDIAAQVKTGHKPRPRARDCLDQGLRATSG